jgi:protein-L-isoaspartate(D-aspartate) O-methyltransferase
VPVAIGHGQVTTQPSLSARMIEGLRLEGREHVLEIGTGPGPRGADRAGAMRQWTDQK